MTRIDRDRVYAYITHQRRLLILEHPQHPEAGLQVPGGTVEMGEDPEKAVLREVIEETGLSQIELIDCLGTDVFDMRPYGMPETQRAWFFHVACHEETPGRWCHQESHSVDVPIPFRLYWADLPYHGEPLIAFHGHRLVQLPEHDI